MLPQVCRNEGALRNDLETMVPGKRERRAGELGRDPSPPKCRGHFGVHEDQRAVAPVPILELGDSLRESGLEALRCFVVHDGNLIHTVSVGASYRTPVTIVHAAASRTGILANRATEGSGRQRQTRRADHHQTEREDKPLVDDSADHQPLPRRYRGNP